MDKNKRSKKSSFFWLISVCFISIGLLIFCQFFFGDNVSDATTFYQNTFVNDVDISGLTLSQANTLLQADLIENKEKINIKLKNNNKEWEINGNDFEIVGNFEKTLNETINYGRDGNIFQKKKFENKIKKEGLNVNVPYQNLLGGLDGQLDKIIAEIEKEPLSSRISFEPDNAQMFHIVEGENGIVVDREALSNEISNAIKFQDEYLIDIPTKEIVPDTDVDDYINNICLRASFSSNFSKSSSARKSNVKKALSAFNGMIVEPGQEVSFNNTTGSRTAENGYKVANIIYNGSYTPGVGGGVCQASSTLYNALLLADVEVLEAHHHTLPASYVPLSFDAMVSEGNSDLVFKNNLETPLYIKTYCTDNDCFVEIYGQPFDDNILIKTRSELVKIIPHSGDEIVVDYQGKYSDKVLYKGEYYRLKYPNEGYETKGYIQYIKDGKVIEEKEIRHDRYSPQQGIIIEGSSSLEEGMTIPTNDVKYIAPQKITEQTIINAKKKWKIN